MGRDCLIITIEIKMQIINNSANPLYFIQILLSFQRS